MQNLVQNLVQNLTQNLKQNNQKKKIKVVGEFLKNKSIILIPPTRMKRNKGEEWDPFHEYNRNNK